LFLFSSSTTGWLEAQFDFRRFTALSIQNIKVTVTDNHNLRLVFNYDIGTKFQILKWKHQETPRPKTAQMRK
jgi:hypothetical protein